MRINKYLAAAGVASRRGSESLVTDGRVKLNGAIVTDLSTDVKDGDVVTFDDNVVAPKAEQVYLMLNKPKGCLCTVTDDRGRKTVMDYIREKNERLFPVGRLDYDTEGLLLITTDGEFANLLTHPSHEIEKTYVARVEGEVTQAQLATLRKGVMIEGRRTHPAKAKLLAYDGTESRVEIVISEGRNRQVRRMIEAIGHKVAFLKRTKIGPLQLGGLGRGMYRPLTEKEISYFLIKK